MKRTVLFFLSLVFFSLYPSESKAQLTTEQVVGISAGLNYTPGIFASLRLHEPHTFWSIETFAVIPWGFGTNFSLDLVRTKKLTIKMLDLGVFVPLVKKMSVTDINRDYDLVVGAGATWHHSKKISFVLDWRAYLPDPALIFFYGDFIRPIYTKALKEGNLCLAISFSL